MQFEYLKFKNYRPYYGEQTIYFQDNDPSNENSPFKKNIVLIGGLNGHGKTSLITSIFIALYGHRYFKNQSEYNNLISECVNKKHVNEGGNSGSIELAFTDDTGNYAIEVIFEKDKLGEIRKVHSLNEELKKVNELHFTMEEYNDFIDSRIPLDVAQFFIFDAEKIRDLVGEQDNEDTKRAIQKVISLELYRQLLKDLDKIHYDYTRELRSSISDKDLDELFEKIETTTLELDNLQDKADQFNNQLKTKIDEEVLVQQERRRLLASASLTKQKLNKLIGEYEQKVKQINKDLHHSVSKLHNIILQPYIKELKIQIKKERDYLDTLQREKIKFTPYDEFISELLKVDISPSLTAEQKDQLTLKGKEVWAKLNNIRQSIINKKIEILHDITHSDFKTLTDYREEKNNNIKELYAEKQNYEKLLDNYYSQLEDAPEEVDTTVQDKKIKELNQEIGEIRTELKNINKRIQSLRNEKYQLTNIYTRKHKEFEKVGPIQNKITLLDSLRNATEEFIEKVTISKAKQLKREIEIILQQLFRKEDLQKVEFDDQKFTLTIYNEYGDPIDLTSRSEGEKQLIALAMIWALTKVSGSNFPFVIDTPLARLDSIHRSNLVNHYFTKLSDQVVILSTDTEITSDFYQELKPFIEQEYTLEFNPDENFTEIQKGYFFKEDQLWHV